MRVFFFRWDRVGVGGESGMEEARFGFQGCRFLYGFKVSAFNV